MFIVTSYGSNRKLIQWLKLETTVHNKEDKVDKDGVESPRGQRQPSSTTALSATIN